MADKTVTHAEMISLAHVIAQANGVLVGLAVKMIAPDKLNDFIDLVNRVNTTPELDAGLRSLLESAEDGLDNVRYDISTK